MTKPNIAKLEILASGLRSGELDIDEVAIDLTTQELLMLGGMLEAYQEMLAQPVHQPVSVTRKAARLECEVLDEIERAQTDG